MANYLITGARNNTPHVTSADDGSLNGAIFGDGVYITKRGEQLRTEIISNNLVRLFDGDLIIEGRQVRIEPSSYVDLTINNGDAGTKRNDLIVAHYEYDVDTATESVDFIVIEGTASANPVDPEYTEGSILDGDLEADFPLYRVSIDGINIVSVERLVDVNAVATLGRGIALSSGADLNELNEIGVYYARNSEIAETILHTPDVQMSNFKLVVEKMGSNTGLRQTMYLGSSNARVFHRITTSSGWQAWTWERLNNDIIDVEHGGLGVDNIAAMQSLLGITNTRVNFYTLANNALKNFDADKLLMLVAYNSEAHKVMTFYLQNDCIVTIHEEGVGIAIINMFGELRVTNSTGKYLYIIAVEHI